jgi:carboxylesterase
MDSPVDVMPGCAPVSHRVGSRVGVLVLHGFTGNPSSVRGLADAMIDAGFDVELPRLPGHGTVIDDMLETGWADWYGEAERAFVELTSRVERVVVVGQSMGATLGLATALEHHDVAGLVCVNPLTRARDAETMAMIDDFVHDGLAVVPGEGSDIADPASSDIAYDGTPLVPLLSLLHDGILPITDRFGALTSPLRLFTSRHDHVVDPGDSEHLVATYGGPVDHTWLERSYHVATLDYERDLVLDESVAFAQRVTA